MAAQQAAPLDAALRRLRDAVEGIRLPLPLADAQAQRATAAEICFQLDDYVLPRLASLDAPLLAVVGGSTGAGKSTLVNSLMGRRVTEPGVIRPTTRAPVLVHHPDDARWFADDRVLPGLARSSGSAQHARALQLVSESSIPAGLAVLDAPDIDSVVQENRELAGQLLAAADLWLFVTSAARYADAVPWDFLLSAARRSAAVAVVLDRVPPRASRDVPAHLGQMMSERGLADSPLFAVPETTVDDEGLLPDAAVAPIRGWLAGLARDKSRRASVVQQTLDGAIRSLLVRAPSLARASDEQVETLRRLRAEADHSYAEAVRSVGVQTADGTLLRGEVLARWHDFVGTGEFFRALEQRIGWLRDRVVAAIRGEPPGAQDLQVAVESGLESLLRQEGDAAAERAEAGWQAHAAGRDLLGRTTEDLAHSSPAYLDRAERVIRDWQGAVLDLVADEGMTKRSRARFLAFGVNGIGVALMIVVFAHTGGLVGAEVGVAGGTAILAQRVLEAVFGDQAVRRLAESAKEELDARVETLLSQELLRYHTLLDTLAIDPEQAESLRNAAEAVAAARAAGLAGGSPSALGTPAQPALSPTADPPALEAAGRPALSGTGADILDAGWSRRGGRGRGWSTPRWRARRWRAARRRAGDAEVAGRRRRHRRCGRGAVLMAGSLVERGRSLLGRRESSADLVGRVRALKEAAERCEGRVSPELVAAARRTVDQADRRLAISGGATVVALAGATGSGKSSTFNALAGTDLAGVGVRRPTTSAAMAVSWGPDSAEELLDWLQVSRRHVLETGPSTRGPGTGELDGLVLLDLPDHDSTATAHRTEVDRLVALVDVLVWIVDPQKYADAALHQRYLRPLAGHAEVMLVVLNQIDTLTSSQRAACLADLRRLLDGEGLSGVEVLGVSAATGEGLAALTSRLARQAADKRAAARRLAADVGAVADRLASASGDEAPAGLDRRVVANLNAELAQAAGVPVVTDAVSAAWRLRGGLATGWPVLSWLAKFKPDPLRRLRLGGGRRGEIATPGRVSRTSLPGGTGVQRARVDSALRSLADAASTGLNRGWADAVKAATRSAGAGLADGLDRAVGSTDLDLDRHRRWWGLIRVLQWVLVAAVLVGLGWLGAAFVLAYLQLPPLPKLTWGGFPAPTVLVVVGVLAGVLLAALARIGVNLGARRRAALARQRLLSAIGAVSEQQVLAPVRDELDRYEATRTALRRARF